MREIKFRGRKPNGEWEYGYYVGKDTIIPFGNVNFDLGFIDTSPCYEVIPDTIGQFTGLHDKNGKEIYEGDIIVSEDYSHARHYVRYISDEAMYVAMIIGSSLMDYCPIRQSWIDKFSKKIISNIHDNPELLNA